MLIQGLMWPPLQVKTLAASSSCHLSAAIWGMQTDMVIKSDSCVAYTWQASRAQHIENQ